MSARTRSLVCLAGGAVLVLSTWFSTAAALPGPLLGAIALDRLRRKDARPVLIPVPALGST